MPDMNDETKGTVAAVAAFLWTNRNWILHRLREVRTWFGTGKGTEEQPGILILGSGGVGKTTLARLLSEEEYNPLLQLPEDYSESVGVEAYSLADAPGVKIVVPPGQRQRRDATWSDLQSDLAAGKFRGVIMLTAYGNHSIMLSYKNHQIYQGDKDRFVQDFCAVQQAEELSILRQLTPHMITSRGKLWMMTVVTKEDLYWPKRVEVERHYIEGEYGGEIKKILASRGPTNFRHEIVLASLVISNFVTGAGETLTQNAAGYDHSLQVRSLRRLLETIYALKEWEAGR